MHHKWRFPNVFFGGGLRLDSPALAILVLLLFLIFVLLFMTLTAPPVQAQTYEVLYNFTGGADGALPMAGLTIDNFGNLYGTASYGGHGTCSNGLGVYGCGTVFEIARSGPTRGFRLLFKLPGGLGGSDPEAQLTFGPDRSLYGTTADGCIPCEPSGSVFRLAPLTNTVGAPKYTVVHRFLGSPYDGSQPDNSPVAFDAEGNMYLTTMDGGIGSDLGTVIELSRSQGGWRERVLYSFQGYPYDGESPRSGVIVDHTGTLYGTTANGGSSGHGTVFELMPSGDGWTENVIYNFQGGSDGTFPTAGLVADRSGNLYGATFGSYYGTNPTVFMLSPLGGGWTFQVLYTLSSDDHPQGTLAIDGAGNLYGTTSGGSNPGHIFQLARGASGWTYSNLHSFCSWSNCADGEFPSSGLLVDAIGNLYGTTQLGGQWDYGVVFEITP